MRIGILVRVGAWSCWRNHRGGSFRKLPGQQDSRSGRGVSLGLVSVDGRDQLEPEEDQGMLRVDPRPGCRFCFNQPDQLLRFVSAEQLISLDILPALKDRDSLYRGCMSATGSKL